MKSEIVYELRRIRSLRSTWVISLLAVGQAVSFVSLFAWVGGMNRYEPQETTRFESLIGFILIPFFVVLVSVLAAQAFGHDYRHGTIRVTMSTFPRRGPFLVARTAVVLAAALLLSLIAILSTASVTELMHASTGGIDWNSVLTAGGKFLAIVVMYCVIVMSLTVIFRSMPIGLVTPMISFSFLEYIVVALTFRWEWVQSILPSVNAIAWASDDTSGWGATNASPLPMLVVTLAVALTAAWKFLKRDV